jgi:aminoglycoside phosphotransferase (APT) family kinase protein
LYLEWISAWRRWPWREIGCAGLVLEQLAHIHSALPSTGFPATLASWDYDTELVWSGQATLELFEWISHHQEISSMRRKLKPLERIVAGLPEIRRQLRSAWGPATVLHGDAHSGNVMIRQQGRSKQALLLDWGRTRLGSPLEDVCCWLQSLGFWEPEARRRHDSLLQHYLAVRGLSTRLGTTLREQYWLASACNGLAGALRYHLSIAADEDRPARRRERAAGAARDWLRIVHRADAFWRN